MITLLELLSLVPETGSLVQSVEISSLDMTRRQIALLRATVATKSICNTTKSIITVEHAGLLAKTHTEAEQVKSPRGSAKVTHRRRERAPRWSQDTSFKFHCTISWYCLHVHIPLVLGGDGIRIGSFLVSNPVPIVETLHFAA